MDDKLGKLQNELRNIEIDLAKAEKLNHRYDSIRLDGDKIKIKKEIDAIKERETGAREYEIYERSKQDSYKARNPSLLLTFNMYVHGQLYEEDEKKKGKSILTLNENGDLVQEEEKKGDKKEIDQIKANIRKIHERVKSIEDETTKKKQQKTVLTELELRSQLSFYDSEEKKLKDELKRQLQGYKPLFYVPLGKLDEETLTKDMFLKNNYVGKERSFENTEENIDMLLKLIFQNKKEIRVIGLKGFDKPLKILMYSWRKKEFPPYGYQTSRGPVDIQPFLETSNLKWLEYNQTLYKVPSVTAKQADTTILTDQDDKKKGEGEDEGEDEDEDEDERAGKKTGGGNEPEAKEEYDERKNLAKIKFYEEEIEKEYTEIKGGGFFDAIQNAITSLSKQNMTNLNRAQAFTEDLLTTNVYKKVFVKELEPKEALMSAVARYKSNISYSYYYSPRWAATWYSYQKLLYEEYMHEYLAYRFSIFHKWFEDDNLTFTSPDLSQQQNTMFLRHLLAYAPNESIRESTIGLINAWNEREIEDDYETAKDLYDTQHLFFQRLQLDLIRRVDMFRPTLNLVMLKILLRETERCSKKKVKECLNTAQRIMFVKYDEVDYTKSFQTDPKWEQKKLDLCEDVKDTKLKIPTIWSDKFKDTKVNGLSKPETDTFPVTFIGMRKEKTQKIEENLKSKLEEYERNTLLFQGRKEIKLAVSLNHVLPEYCVCTLKSIKQIKQSQSRKEMVSVHKLWIEQTDLVAIEHEKIKEMLGKTCHSEILKSGKLSEECFANLIEINVKLDILLKQYFLNVSTPHESVTTPYVKENYPMYYRDLEKIQAKYKEYFEFYEATLARLVQTLQELITKDDASYERLIAQLDYIVDAYNQLCNISLALTCQFELKQRSMKNLYDFKVIIENLSSLCDILEDHSFRGYINGFPIELKYPNYDAEKKEEEKQKEYLDYVKNTVPSPETADEFAKKFAALDPEYVIFQSDSKNLTKQHFIDMFERAKTHCAAGNFARAIQACYLIFVLPVSVLQLDGDLYKHARLLLLNLLKLTGQSTTIVSEIAWPSSNLKRNKILIRFLGTTDDRNVTNLFQQELGETMNNQKIFAKFISNKFLYIDKENTHYAKCKRNYLSLQFYLGLMPTRMVLKQFKLETEDYKQILRFFPKDHVGRTILANVYNAMFGTDVEKMYEFVAEFLKTYQTKRRYALDYLKEDTNNEKKKLQRDIAKCMKDINVAMDKLKYVAGVVKAAKYERENHWPKNGSSFYSTFIRTEPVPYVDGNYNVRIKVDLALGEDSVDNAAKTNCETRKQMLHDITRTLNPFGR
jgi:hypothetical protein